MVASQATTQLLAFATSIVVARFLGPFEVGLAAMALVFGSLALTLVDFGFGPAVIQRPNLTEEDKATAFWAGIVIGVALVLLGVGLSWPIASLYGEPEVQPLFAVLSIAFLLTAPGIVQGALLTRELQFRSLQIRTIIATSVSSATAITLAVAGAGAWAIVAQTLVISGVSTLLLWRASPWRPQATFSTESLRSMAGYAGHVTGAKTLDWGTTNLDNFLVGRFLGAAPLGAYSIAYNLIITPVKRVAHPVTGVFFPAFSKMRDPDRIAAGWLRASRMLALLVTPAMLGLIVVAPDFVEVVFGAQWEDAVVLIQLLAPVGLIQALTSLNIGILQSLARTRTLFRFTAVLSVTTVAAFAAGLPWGVEGVATAYLAVTLVLQPAFLWLTTSAVGITVADWARSVAGVFQAAAVMFFAVLGGRELLVPTELPLGWRLAALIALGAVVYVPIAAWRAPEVLPELRAARKRLRRTPDRTDVEATPELV